MGLWSKKKVDPLDLNKGYEWTKDDQVAVEELNAMTNCSLYAQDFVEKLVTNIDVSEAGVVGTPSVTLVDGDGATEGKPYKKFKFANLKGEKGDTGGVAPVVQGTGTATGSVMSQNAVTTELIGKANLNASNLTDENVTSWRNKLNAGDTLIAELELTSSHKNITITGLDLNSLPSKTIIIDYETKCSGRDFIMCKPNNYVPTADPSTRYQCGLMRLNSSNTSSGAGTLQGYAYVNSTSFPVGETLENITVYKTITIHANNDGSIYSSAIEASCVNGAQSVGVMAGYLPSGAISNMTSILIGLDVSSTQNLIDTRIKIYARR